LRLRLRRFLRQIGAGAKATALAEFVHSVVLPSGEKCPVAGHAWVIRQPGLYTIIAFYSKAP
jgi:hypothetical protein